jgi:large subunit ribosomal protein L23
MSVIIKPIITEKITKDGEIFNRFGFVVDKKANKVEIKKAIESAYGVSVIANKVENKYNFNRLAKVIDYLNSAAQSFEKAGMESEAQEIVNIINEIR